MLSARRRKRFARHQQPEQRSQRMRTQLIVALVLFVLTGGCAGLGGAPSAEPSQKGGTQPASRLVDAQQAERLRRIMVPLAGAMNHPRPLNQVRVAIMDDPRVNAASAGGGEFYVTMGLLLKASDDQLRGVLAHELAHDDLGHVAKAQTLGAGVGIGVIVLDQLFPGSGSFTPLAGALITNGYSRQEEYDADRHGVDLLRGAGYYRVVMINTLTWLLQTGGSSGGGFLASHPGTQDRIDALKKL
jgi:beta-barrel assembly-enhancing protease